MASIYLSSLLSVALFGQPPVGGDLIAFGFDGFDPGINRSISASNTKEKLVQRFKRSVAKEGILKEIKRRKYYEKPSQARRRRLREQEKLIRKKARKKLIKDARRRTRVH